MTVSQWIDMRSILVTGMSTDPPVLTIGTAVVRDTPLAMTVQVHLLREVDALDVIRTDPIESLEIMNVVSLLGILTDSLSPILCLRQNLV